MNVQYPTPADQQQTASVRDLDAALVYGAREAVATARERGDVAVNTTWNRMRAIEFAANLIASESESERLLAMLHLSNFHRGESHEGRTIADEVAACEARILANPAVTY